MDLQNIKIKVCGMREGANILEVSQLHPHYMGFIFYAPSPRYVGDEFQIPENFPADTKRVGVFVNESNDKILKKVEMFKLDFVQLHGRESVTQCRELKLRQVGVIKVFSVGDQMDFEDTIRFQEVADFFLFDTKGKLHGGNGQPFNWQVLTRYDQRIPFFLSGGITPDTVQGVRGISGLNIHALDVNSGVEISPALKDVNKIMAIQAIFKSKTTKQ
jgi:phosphoribosylanthranilate isomerase